MALIKSDINPSTKSGDRLWTLSFIMICLSAFTVTVAFHSLLPTLPIYIQQHGGSQDLSGLALAMLTISAVMIRPITGWALDRYGRKLILIIGLITFLIPSLFYISMVPILPLLMLRFVQGFGWGIGQTAQGTAASDIVPASRIGEGLGIYTLTNSVSMAAAPGIGLWLINSFSFHTLFVFGVVLIIISLIPAFFIKYPKVETPAVPSKLVFMEKLALRPAIVILLVAITYSSLLSFLTLYVQERGMTTAGLFFTVLAVTTFLSRPLSGKIIDKNGEKGYDIAVAVGITTIVIAMLILAQISSPWYLVGGGILFGIGFGFMQPTMLVLSVSSVPAVRRGAANATYWTAFDIGVALGSILWGMIAKHYGYGMMFNLTILPPIASAMIYWGTKKKVSLLTSFSKQ